MEDAMTKPRYQRSSLPARRRGGKNTRTSQTPIAEKIMRQLVISICLLVIIGMVKNINTPITQFVTGKIKAALFQNIDVTKMFEGLDGFLDKNSAEKSKSSITDQTQNEITAGEDSVLPMELTDVDAKGTAQGEKITAERINEINRSLPFILPVTGVVSSPFGERIHPLTQKASFHYGVDLEADQGDPIKAALAGTVEEAGSDASLGNYVRIKHEDGIITVYGHCSELLVKKGSKIKQGDVVANAGDTGLSVGTHLHFEVWVDGAATDPIHFIKVQK